MIGGSLLTSPITIITKNSLQSCKAAKDFLEVNDIPYVEKNVSNNQLTFEEVKDLVVRAGGYEEIISSRSKPYKKMQKMMDSEDFTLFQLYEFIQQNPTSITYPIIYDDYRFQTGYNEEQLKTFLLREQKIKNYKEIMQRAKDIE